MYSNKENLFYQEKGELCKNLICRYVFKTILYTRLQVKENIQNNFISKVLLMLQTSYQITKSSLIQHTTHCTYHGTWKSSTFCRKSSARVWEGVSPLPR